MLPPEKVPPGLDYIEYMKLQMRYTSIGWIRQAMESGRQALDLQPASSAGLSDEARKRASALFDALGKVLILNEVSEEVKKNFRGVRDYTLTEADKALDKFENIKKAKDGIKNVFTMVSQTVQETIDGSLEKHVLPALGLPLDRIPSGLSSDHYYSLAGRYEQIGACEPARECIKKVSELEQKGELANSAAKFMRTKLPRSQVAHDAMTKYMNALRYSLTQETERARDLLIELEVKHSNFEWPLIPLSALELKDGNLARAKKLLDSATTINPNFVKAWCAKGRLAVAEWHLLDLDNAVEKAIKLDAQDSGAIALKNMQDFINQNGLR